MKFNRKVANLKSDNSVISSYDYAYNEIGNRTNVQNEFGDRTTWTYDKTSQLLSEHKAGASPYHTTYTYDPLGNRITKEVASGTTTYTHDNANQLVTVLDVSGITTYTYDANGNQTTVEQPNNDLTTNTWSYENQMLQTELPNNTLFTSIYNSDEMRIAKIDTNDLVTSFIWDDQNYITEFDDLDAVQVEYTYEPQQYGNLISQCRDTETSFHHYDALGSTTDLTDETEVVTDEWNYQAFGEENARTGTTPNPYQWVGQVGYYHDEDRETHQIRARDYQSQVGRFLSRDPIGFAAGDVSLYRYVKNIVVIYSDPGGLELLMPWDRRASWNPITTAKAWGSQAKDLAIGQPGDWLDRDFSNNPGYGEKGPVGKTVGVIGNIASNVPGADTLNDVGEALGGRDANGNKLSNTDRGIAGGAILLPWLNRKKIKAFFGVTEEMRTLTRKAPSRPNHGRTLNPNKGRNGTRLATGGNAPSNSSGCQVFIRSGVNPDGNFPNRPPASPAVYGSPYSPGEVSRRQSQLRRELNTGNLDPDSPIPDVGPGRDLGGHTSTNQPRHTTGERNVASSEEHSRVPKKLITAVGESTTNERNLPTITRWCRQSTPAN